VRYLVPLGDGRESHIVEAYPSVWFDYSLEDMSRFVSCPECTGWDWVVPELKVEPVPVPVESPDDWVTQDLVPFRPLVDQVQWLDRDGESLMEWQTFEYSFDKSHGYTNSSGLRLCLRCQRRDLPVPATCWRCGVSLLTLGTTRCDCKGYWAERTLPDPTPATPAEVAVAVEVTPEVEAEPMVSFTIAEWHMLSDIIGSLVDGSNPFRDTWFRLNRSVNETRARIGR